MDFKEKESIMEKKRLIGLDVFRVLAAIVIFLFHSRTGMEYHYGVLQPFLRMGAIFMTGFFMMSGFCLYLSSHKKSLMKLSDMVQFYVKRFIGIMPIYYVAALLYIVLLGKETVLENVILAPIELLGLQATMQSMFQLSHNIGTWFISCLVILYILYPFMQEVVRQMTLKAKVVLMCLAGFVLMWVAIVIWKFKLDDIYTNPFFRGLEFLIGVLLASCKEELEKIKLVRFFMQWKMFILELAILIVSVTVAVKRDFAVGNYMTYDIICLPIFVLMIFTLSGVTSANLEKSKVLRYMSDSSYAFFLAQFFTWELSRSIMKYFNWYHNIGNILLSLCICIIITIILHEAVEKPLKRLCMSMYNRWVQKSFNAKAD